MPPEVEGTEQSMIMHEMQHKLVCRWRVRVNPLHTLPGYILLVNKLLSPCNCFHGLRGEKTVSSCETETDRVAVNDPSL